MMKKYLFLIMCLALSYNFFAQSVERDTISGSIQMPEQIESEGISVFNLNTKRGTVTKNQGKFKIAVAEGDSLRISSVQFQPFTVIIDKGIVESGRLNISVNEVLNVLPEVVVTPYDLSGNVRVDLKRLQVVQLPDTLNAMEVQSTYFESETGPDYQSPPRNEALRAGNTRLINGLNFANIFRELFTQRKRDQIAQVDPVIDVQIRQLYEDEFYRENLGIARENIGEFLDFIDEKGLTEEMLQEGGELDLIQYLIEESKRFKKKKGAN